MRTGDEQKLVDRSIRLSAIERFMHVLGDLQHFSITKEAVFKPVVVTPITFEIGLYVQYNSEFFTCNFDDIELVLACTALMQAWMKGFK